MIRCIVATVIRIKESKSKYAYYAPSSTSVYPSKKRVVFLILNKVLSSVFENSYETDKGRLIIAQNNTSSPEIIEL